MNKETKFDLHTHHERCGHAIGTIEDYILAAIDQELDVIGISDHTPYFYSDNDHLYPRITMKKSEFSNYINDILQLKERYANKIDVLLGVEADFFPEHLDIYKANLKKYPFDYIIGSVHYVLDESIFNKRRWDNLTHEEKVNVKDTYYRMIRAATKSGLFHIIGHIDAMKANYPPFSDIETSELEETLKVIGESGVAIEVNTSGKTKEVGGWYPADDILERALFYNVAITFGSDAHTPERVGDDFDEVRQKLKDIGFKSWCYIKEQKKIYVPID